jgi:hypothetical protein
MKTLFFSNTVFLLMLIAVSSILSGCSYPRRLYLGEPLPRQDVALIFRANLNLGLPFLLDEDNKKVILPKNNGMLHEVLPGHYILCLDYNYGKTTSSELVKQKLEVKPNQIYVIGHRTYINKWKVIVSDLDHYIPDPAGGELSKETIRNMADDHFKGDSGHREVGIEPYNISYDAVLKKEKR